MDSTMIDLGIFQIKWYSFFVFLGILFAFLITWKEVKKKKVSEDYMMDVAFYGILFGILGARVYYVLFHIAYYWQNPLEIFMVWNGGLAIHGGILAFLIFLYYYTKKKGYRFLLTLDLIAPGVILGQAIGRWGNFFNQEAFGRVVSLSFLKNLHLPKFIIDGMYIEGSYREPTFLYESVASFLGFIVLLLLRKNKETKTGQLTGMYLIWYGIERIIIESFRSDSLMLGPMKIAQLVSILFILVGLFLFFKNQKREKNYHKDLIH